MTPQQESHSEHRDLEGLNEFITGYFGATATTQQIALAEAAWYQCMSRRAPAPSEPAVDRDAVTVDHQKIKDAAYFLVLNKKDSFAKGWPLFVQIADEVLATPASPAVPAESKLLPLVSTRQMDEAGCRVLPRGCDITDAERCYAAMLAAAPQVAQASQPTSAEGKDSERLEGDYPNSNFTHQRK